MQKNSVPIGPRQLIDSDQRNIWHPFSPLVGGSERILIESGEGARLFTSDGKTLIDGVSSWWVNIHGHCNPQITQAITDQASRLEHVIFAGFTHRPAVQLAENLLTILPSNMSKVFFSDDGSTSVEVGLKMAIQYWFNRGEAKRKIIAIEGAYHGDTFGSMSVAERGTFNEPFHSFLFDVDFIPFPAGDDASKSIETMRALTSGGDVAAFIFEPLVQGAGGMRMYEPGILDQLIEIAQNHGALCIADEVMTGFGRTGRLFASDYLRTSPDVFCLSKGITGGFLPLGVTCCSEEIESAFKTENMEATFFHGHSYTANPITCAAANASYEILIHPETRERIERIAKSQDDFREELVGNPKVRNVRNRGTILALDLETGKSNSYFDSNRNRIYNFFLEKGILLRPLGNTIYIMPPYVITKEDLEKIHSAIREFLQDY